ncbi:hypothetical protein JTB14_013911 [Gonioctena quinquepunctata]|nr:hypothetical protein JTB14_013911 [Gonioctena quinquepunctata]
MMNAKISKVMLPVNIVEHNTDSEQSDEDVENFVQEIEENRAYGSIHHFTGKDKKTHWMAYPPRPNKDTVLLSYKAKPKKNVLMLSSFHSGDNIDPESGDLQKPEIVTFYNLTKGGVDVVDELKSTYSISRFSCRWPLRIFFTIPDIAAINSNIVYETNTGVIEERRIHLDKLAEDLIKPLLVERSSIRSLPIDIRSMLRAYLNLPHIDHNRDVSSGFYALSRLPLTSQDIEGPPLQGVLMLESVPEKSFTAEEIAKKTKEDRILSKVSLWIQTGWTDDKNKVPEELKQF